MLERAIRDYMAAKEFGWLPSEVDGESVIRLRGIMTVAEVFAEIRAEAQRIRQPGG